MSVWAELKRVVNDNFNYPLNKQHFYPVSFGMNAEFIESSTTYSAPQTGIYIITCVGKGGDAYTTLTAIAQANYNLYFTAGGGGAVCKGYVILNAGQTVAITVDASRSSFGSYLSAGAGTVGTVDANSQPAPAAGGTVLISGNIFNYNGFPGSQVYYNGGTITKCVGGNAGLTTMWSLNDGYSQGYLPVVNFTELTGGDGGTPEDTQGKAGKFGGGIGGISTSNISMYGARGGGGYGGGGNWAFHLQSNTRRGSASGGGKGVVIIEHGITLFG